MFPSHCHYITHHHNWQHYLHLWILRTRGGGGHQGNIYFQIQQNSSTLEFSNSEAGRRLARKKLKNWDREVAQNLTICWGAKTGEREGQLSFMTWLWWSVMFKGEPYSYGVLVKQSTHNGEGKRKIKGKTESSVLWVEK